MTDTTTLAPTDAEIWREWELILATSNPTAGTAAIKLARTAIAKWGAPAPASGEAAARALLMDVKARVNTLPALPAVERREYAIRIKQDIADFLAAPPAQEVRTPLDEWDILQRAAGHSHPGTAGYDIELVRFVESAHGIITKK